MSGRQKDHAGNAKAAMGNKTIMGYLSKEFDPYSANGPSWEHFQSVKELQDLTFKQWKQGALTLAECARNIMDNETITRTKTNEQSHNIRSSVTLKEGVKVKKKSTIRNNDSTVTNSVNKKLKCKSNIKLPNQVSFQTSQVGSAPILDNVFWVDYEPHGSSIIFLHFDLDGEILDVDCHKFEFSDCRTIITRLSKVPAILQNVPVVFKSIEQAGRNTEDSYQVLMQNETKKREKTGAALLDGFEVRAKVILPYPVKPFFFDKEMNSSTTFQVSITDEGSAFVNLWLKKAD